MPKIGVVWLRGYDSDSVCDKVVRINPSNLQVINDSKSSSHYLTIFLIILFVVKK